MNANALRKDMDARQAYYERIARDNLTPLWEVLHALVPPSPTPSVVPALWRYAALRETLLESGELISAMEAERRVLILENPGARGLSRITQKGAGARQSWEISGLVADSRTEREVSNGQPPSYFVAIKRAGGDIDVLPNRVTFDPSKVLTKYEAKLRNALSTQEAVRTGNTGMPLP